jgi:uncharacterized protein (TIGR02996 family)
MDQASAFLQAILESPDDDVPRLVYADWLDEQGESAATARAALIRVQFALRDLPADDPRRLQLEECERDLLVAHESAWTDPLRRHCHVQRCRFRGGFVERVVISVEDFLAEAERLFTLAPVREVCFLPYGHLPRSADSLPQLADSPHLQRLSAVDLSSFYLDESGARALAGSPHLTRLETLRLNVSGPAFCGILADAPFLGRLGTLGLTGFDPTAAGLALLLRSPRLAKLTQLQLSNGNSSGRSRRRSSAELWPRGGATHLAGLTTLVLSGWPMERHDLQALAAASLPRLRTLDLSGDRLCAESVRLLADAPLLAGLEALNLSSNRLGDAGVKALAASPHLGRLARLDLSANGIGPAGVRALAGAQLPSLAALHLRTNKLGDEGLAALAAAPGLPALAVLGVSYNGIGPAGVAALAKSLPGRLAVLDLSWNALTDEAVAALAVAAGAERLTGLSLGYARLGDAAARALAESRLGRLATLNLGTNLIGEAGVRALAESPHLRSLTALNLGSNQVGDAGARALAGTPLFGRLTALHLAGNALGPDVVRELRQEFRGILGC